MPQIFKALATITAWILWISGWVMGFSAFVMGIVSGRLYGTEPPPMVTAAMFAVAGFYAILAVVVMRLRQKMG